MLCSLYYEFSILYNKEYYNYNKEYYSSPLAFWYFTHARLSWQMASILFA